MHYDVLSVFESLLVWKRCYLVQKSGPSRSRTVLLLQPLWSVMVAKTVRTTLTTTSLIYSFNFKHICRLWLLAKQIFMFYMLKYFAGSK